jgi:NADH-quinone oxidoreductase subunit M
MNLPYLTAALLLPLLGAVAVMALPRVSRPGAASRSRTELPKVVALGVSLVTLALVLVMAARFEPGGGFQFTEQHTWIAAFGAYYALGVDGIGLTLVLLTAILTPVVILASWNDGELGRWSVNSFFAWMLALEGFAIGVFAATDVFLFYVLFEATLLPVYFLIGGFGGPRRSFAALKFLVFMLLGGLIMLASVIGLYVESARAGGPTYLISELAPILADSETATGRWLFLGFFLAFAIKAPLVPLHTWLPDAADEATPGTSVLMVSVLDKIGTYGMIRFCLGLFPEASTWATPVVMTLAVISVLYGALVAIGQDRLMRLVAFTSVSHFGLIVLGIFALNRQGETGAVLYMFNHGLATGLLFLVCGFLIARRGSGWIRDYGGVQQAAPVLAGMLLVAALASLSLPGLAPFVSEYLVLVGAFVRNVWYGVFAVLGMVLAALYMLLMYQRTMTGPQRPDATVPDLGPREVTALAPLVVLLLALGFFPQPLIDAVQPAVDTTLSHVGAEDPAPTVDEADLTEESE